MKEQKQNNRLRVALEETLLSKGEVISAGSRMLADTRALFDSAAKERMTASGIDVCARVRTGEFSIDLLGETADAGAIFTETALRNPAAELILSDCADACVMLDVNGSGRRAAAQAGLVYLKPTYGTISRYGAVSAVPSGETVSVMARNVSACECVLHALAGNDRRDPTSLPEKACARVRERGAFPGRIALIADMQSETDGTVRGQMEKSIAMLRGGGAEIVSVQSPVIAKSHAAWNVILCAELCKSTARYDGVRFGYRAKRSDTLEELYINSRTEGFGSLLKYAILYGSEVLSAENYERVFLRALRVRTLVREEFSKLFSQFDAVMMPAVSTVSYAEEWLSEKKFPSFEENFYTSPASLCGLPTVVCGGVQLVGDAFYEGCLLAAAKMIAEGECV